jgi:acetyl esterase/lipase
MLQSRRLAGIAAAIRRFASSVIAIRLALACVPAVALSLAPGSGFASEARVLYGIHYSPYSSAAIGDLFLPSDASDAPRAAVLVIHGGAWMFGSKLDPKVRAIASLLQAHGYVAFAIDYHLGNRYDRVAWPQNLMDCKVAVRWLRANAQTYHIAPDRIAAVGFSAGGQLATMLAAGAAAGLEPAQPYPGVPTQVSAVVDFYGPVVVRGPMTAKFSADIPVPGPDREASPLSYVQSGFPPTMIVFGDRDNPRWVADAQHFRSALDEARVPNKFILVPGERHGFNPLAPGLDLAGPVLAFLAEYVGPKH